MDTKRAITLVLIGAALMFAGAARAEDEQTITVRVPRYKEQQHLKALLGPPGTKVITDFSKGDMVFEEFTLKVGPNAAISQPGGVVIVDGSAVIVPGHYCGGRYFNGGFYGCGCSYYSGYGGYWGPYYGYYGYGNVYVQSTFAQPSDVGLFLGGLPVRGR